MSCPLFLRPAPRHHGIYPRGGWGSAQYLHTSRAILVADGSDLLFGGTCDIGPTAWLLSLEELEVDICLSGSEGCAFGSSSPGPGLTGQGGACFSANAVPVLDDARAPETSPTPMLSQELTVGPSVILSAEPLPAVDHQWM
jgi:hypothetical protein